MKMLSAGKRKNWFDDSADSTFCFRLGFSQGVAIGDKKRTVFQGNILIDLALPFLY